MIQGVFKSVSTLEYFLPESIDLSGLNEDNTNLYTFSLYWVLKYAILNLKEKFVMPRDMPLPSTRGYADTTAVYPHVFAGQAGIDIDGGDLTKTKTYYEMLNCLYNTLRQMPWNDDAILPESPWTGLLEASGLQRKKDYIMGLYASTSTDGNHIYSTNFPTDNLLKSRLDLQSLYFTKKHGWHNHVDKFFAHTYLFSHRVQAIEKSDMPSTVPTTCHAPAFVMKASVLAEFKIRPGYGKLGADMYFDKRLNPVMVKTPEGKAVWECQAAGKDWQYWRFVWRSSMHVLVTAIDHLWTGHYSTSGGIVMASHEALAANHPLRRFLTMWTFLAVKVNQYAIPQLVTPNAVMHRSTPFADWHHVAKGLRSSMPSYQFQFERFFEQNVYDALAPEIKEIPYFQDAPLLWDALYNFVSRFIDVYAHEWVDESGIVTNADILFFIDRFKAHSMLSTLKQDFAWLGVTAGESGGAVRIEGLKKLLTVVMFVVSGFHRHAGQTGDASNDPDLLGWSFRDQSASAPPHSAVQLSIISAFTSQEQPKIDQDYAFLCKGIEKEDQCKIEFGKFRESMKAVSVEVTKRNQYREFVYLQMDPKYVEISISV
jgi:hypothetical protein